MCPRRSSPNRTGGEVPVLVHDGAVLTETTLILEYLDAAFPHPSLVPETAEARYRMRVWTKLANDSFAPALTLLGWHLRMARQMCGRRDRAAIVDGFARLPPDRQAVWHTAFDDAYSEDQLTRAREFVEVAARRLDEALAGSEWLAGERYSLADIAIFPLAYAMQSLLPDVAALVNRPRVAQWLERMQQRPAVRRALGFARSARPEEMFAPGPELARWG
ncbi:MAG TPA: glutathione S-transferase family protein [Steroidobacteraceae bacterium]|nr:glutathione S-transferase family protein [Steroidobacteraceae bacterium]